jgi:hypothetical protein
MKEQQIKRQIKTKIMNATQAPAILMPKDSILCSTVFPGDGMNTPYCVALHPGLSSGTLVVHLWNCQTGGYACGDYFTRNELEAAVDAYEIRCKKCGVEPYPPTTPATRNIA